MIKICRDYGKPPSWWDTVAAVDRAAILAFYYIEAEERRTG